MFYVRTSVHIIQDRVRMISELMYVALYYSTDVPGGHKSELIRSFNGLTCLLKSHFSNICLLDSILSFSNFLHLPVKE